MVEFEKAFFMEKNVTVVENDGTSKTYPVELVKISNGAVQYDEFMGTFKINPNIFRGSDNEHIHYTIRLFCIDDTIDNSDRLHIDEDFRIQHQVPVSYESEMIPD